MAFVCRLKRVDLIALVKANREKHFAELEQMRVWYKDRMRVELAEASVRAARGEEIKTYECFRAPWPKSHLDSYDRALAMFEHSVDDLVALDSNDYAKLVDDDWDWKTELNRTTDFYSPLYKTEQLNSKS